MSGMQSLLHARVRWPPLLSVWRDPDDGKLLKVVAYDTEGWPHVRAANGRGASWSVNPGWFAHWERTS